MANINTWVKIGVRNLFKNKRRSFFTMGAIALGFAAVNIFGGFTAYMFRGLEDSFIYAQANGHLALFRKGFLTEGALNPEKYLFTETDLATVQEVCAGFPEVDIVAPQLALSGLISNGKVSTIFVGVGKVPSKMRAIRDKGKGLIGRVKLYDGKDLEDDDLRGVGLSKGLADKLKLGFDSDLTLMGPTIDGQMNALDAMLYQLFDAPSEVLNDKMVGMTFKFAQTLYDSKSADRITVLLKNQRNLEKVKQSLEEALAAKGVPVDIKTWEELSFSFLKIRDMFTIIFLFVFIIVFVIVVLSVVNTISMAVMERTREIGTLRSLGLRRKGVVMLFAIESAMLGLFGSLMGLILTLASWLAIYISKPTWVPPTVTKRVPLEIYIVPEYIVLSLVFLVILAIIAAVLPARRAARMSIIDALGHV